MWDSMTAAEMWPTLIHNRQVLLETAPRCVFPRRLGDVFHAQLGLPLPLSQMNSADAFCADLPVAEQAKYADIVARVVARTDDDQVMYYVQSAHAACADGIGGLAYISLYSTNAGARFLATRRLATLSRLMRERQASLRAAPGVPS
jgi:hypothetical protein